MGMRDAVSIRQSSTVRTSGRRMTVERDTDLEREFHRAMVAIFGHRQGGAR